MSKRSMQDKFRKVYLEIDKIDAKILKKEGFLFFKSHVYSVEELLESPQHQKIESITKKIGDDAQMWYKVGRFGKEEEEIYYDEKEKVDNELKKINRKISEREPTWWEEFKGPLVKFVMIIANNLPDTLKLDVITFIKKATNLTIPFFGKALKMLPLK